MAPAPGLRRLEPSGGGLGRLERHERSGHGELVTGGDTADEPIAVYRYDALGRRVLRTDKSGESDVQYDDYYNQRWQLLETRKDEDADPLKQYVWSAQYIDAPVVCWRDSDTDGTVDETLGYLTDANFNVTGVMERAGIASTDVDERYTYTPYGEGTVYDGSWSGLSASAYENTIRFCGYRWDAETGLYHVRHRMYHAPLGRWLQRDPKGYVDGSSLYGYCHSRPPNMRDAHGTDAHLVAPMSDVSIEGKQYWAWKDSWYEWFTNYHVRQQVDWQIAIKTEYDVQVSVVGPTGGGQYDSGTLLRFPFTTEGFAIPREGNWAEAVRQENFREGRNQNSLEPLEGKTCRKRVFLKQEWCVIRDTYSNWLTRLIGWRSGAAQGDEMRFLAVDLYGKSVVERGWGISASCDVRKAENQLKDASKQLEKRPRGLKKAGEVINQTTHLHTDGELLEELPGKVKHYTPGQHDTLDVTRGSQPFRYMDQ